MKIKHFFIPGLSINSYLVFDEEVKCGVLIDPTRQIDNYLAYAKGEQIEIIAIIETHVHADFLSGALLLKQALKNKPKIYCSGMGGQEWVPLYADCVVKDRDLLQIGAIRFEAWHTPGHTPEHLMWLAYDEGRNRSVAAVAFTGDVLFVGSVGRPDLLGEELEKKLAKQLFQTLFRLLHPMPEFIEVYPAHGAGSACGKGISAKSSSTFGYEKRCNPWFMPQEFGKWEKQLLHRLATPPLYFSRTKQKNLQGSICVSLQESRQLSDQEMRKALASCLVIDFRRLEDFSKGHLIGSINIPEDVNMPLWIGSVIEEEQELILVVDKDPNPVIDLLQLVGDYRVRGTYLFNSSTSEELSDLLMTTPLLETQELHKDNDKYYIVDVRQPKEWDEGHIEQAHHCELTTISQAINHIPFDQKIAVICRSGKRASIASSLLRKQGHQNVFNVKGGMLNWQKNGLPVVEEKE